MKNLKEILLYWVLFKKTQTFMQEKTRNQVAHGLESTSKPVSWLCWQTMIFQSRESASQEVNLFSASSKRPLMKVSSSSNTMRKSSLCWALFWAKDNFIQLSTWWFIVFELKRSFIFAVKWRKTLPKFWKRTFATACVTVLWMTCGKRPNMACLNSSQWSESYQIRSPNHKK